MTIYERIVQDLRNLAKGYIISNYDRTIYPTLVG